ncbi:MAG: hypothetical protein JO056_08885 [Alphaproteobacteria bacterium]|nr:hypothetical protein [Alphaproteobacteria bacterium]
MFRVEWLRNGVRVDGQAMFGDTAKEVLHQARREAWRLAHQGNCPDTIRITEADAEAPLVARIERFAA